MRVGPCCHECTDDRASVVVGVLDGVKKRRGVVDVIYVDLDLQPAALIDAPLASSSSTTGKQPFNAA